MATPIMPKAPLVTRTIGVTEAAPTAPAEFVNPAPASDMSTEEQAAEILLALLPKYIADHIREMSYVHNRQPLWSMVAGHLLKAYENGDVQAPLMDPSWPRKFQGLPTDPRGKTTPCEYEAGPRGKHEFTPKRYKQRFCSNECGTAAAMAPPKPLAPSA